MFPYDEIAERLSHKAENPFEFYDEKYSEK